MWRLWKAPDLRWALPATNRCMVNPQVVLLSAPTSSLASILVIGPHHGAATHVGAEVAPKWGVSRSTWSGWVFTESGGLSSCVLVTISPRRPRQVGPGACPAGGARSTPPPPPRDPHRWRTTGGAVAGAQLGTLCGNLV
jgi:hypothetical protein